MKWKITRRHKKITETDFKKSCIPIAKDCISNNNFNKLPTKKSSGTDDFNYVLYYLKKN